jgi:MFS family permease
MGFSGWQIGFVVSCYAFAPLLFSFPTGWLNDHFSLKRIIQGALLTTCGTIFLLSRTEGYPGTALLFLILGMANNALDVSINNLYYKEETYTADANRKYGYLVFWLSLGMAAGSLIGGVLTHIGNFKLLFRTYSAIPLLALFFTGRIKEVQGDFVTLKDYRLSLINRKTILFSLLLFVLTLHWGVEGTVYSPFIKSFFGLNNLQVSVYISCPLFALAFSAFFIGRMKYNAHTNRRIFLSAMLLSGSGHALMTAGNIVVSFMFRVMHEIGDGLMGALIVLYISRLFEKKAIGGSSGVMTAVMTLGHMAGTFSFSLIGFRLGLQYPFLISGGLIMANAVFGYYIFSK